MKLYIAIAAYLFVGYMNEFISQNEVYHDINQPPLYDIGHNILPVTSPIYANVGVGLFIAYFVLRWGIRHPRTLINGLWMITVLFIFRIVILSVTQLPPPSPGCSTVSKGDPLHFNIVSKGFNECMDLMYSGHTIHCVIISLFVLYLSPYTWEKRIVSFLAVVELLCIISSRMHYTADVIVASLVSFLIFVGWTDIDSIFDHWHYGGLYGKLLKTFK